MTMLITSVKGNYAGYGCVVGNIKKDPEDTVAFQELKHNFGLDKEDIYIDVVSVNVKKRPVLNELLDNMKQYDRIYISDISDLLGKTNKAREYYKKALDKGIELFITDLHQTLFHIHPLSIIMPETSLPFKLDTEVMLKKFDEFVATYEPPIRAGRRKCYISDFSLEWKQLYFAYESYQIDLETALDRAKQFGVNNYPTFLNLVSDYEKSLEYDEDVLTYTRQDPEFLDYPKRVIKRVKGSYILPSEYYAIKERAERDNHNIDINKGNYKDAVYVPNIGEEMNFLINNVTYKRYQNLETMRVPRKIRKEVNIEFSY